MTRVIEFVEIVNGEPRKQKIDKQVNKWISGKEKTKPGFTLEIQDVKYHTQYRKEQDDMVHSVLIIWGWKKDDWSGSGHKRNIDYNDLERSLTDALKPDKRRQRDRNWYSTPDRSWAESKEWKGGRKYL
jgi:hypothetical protein